MKKIGLILLLCTPLVNFLNAQSWSPVGSGIGSPSYSSVRCFATYNGELYIGGYFSATGNVSANNIAKWNGTNWSPVGNGIGGSVYSLCVFNNELYAGGYFGSAGSLPANCIAKWNGSSWSTIGSIQSYGVNAMTVFNGELYVAGSFPDFYTYGTSIVKWDGTNWIAVLPDNEFYTVSIESMVAYNGNLYAAGAYYQIGGGGVPEYYRITKWDGANWAEFLTIPASYTLDGALGDIFSMAVYNGELYIAGMFSMMIDSSYTSQIAKWNGATWSAAGTGINAESFPYGDGSDGSSYTFVKTLAVCNGALYAGGRFNYAGSFLTRNVAKWDGNAWSGLDLGTNGNVYALAGFDSSIYVGGAFTAVDGNNVPANKIAKWREPCITAPLQPLLIHGSDTVCRNSSYTFYVNEAAGTGGYTWTLPPGWTGNSTTNTITVITGDSDGTIAVSANNFCGSSPSQSLHVTVLSASLPFIQTIINGNDTPCVESTQTYLINRVSNATSYTWTLPPGWSGNSTDTSITVIPSLASGLIAVRANNDCGSSLLQVLPVTVATPPHRPNFIYGKQTVCIGSSNLFYVFSSQTATNYVWEFPQGWAGNSNTDSITIAAGNNNGIISVRAYNSCGISDQTILPVNVDAGPLPPASIVGNIYTNTHTANYYSIDPVAGAISYSWTVSSAIMQGQNSNSISAIWKNPGVYELSVQASNKCGSTAPRKIVVNVVDFNNDDPYQLQIFPNPSNGEFLLKAKRIQDKTIGIEILAMSGQLVYRSEKRYGVNDFSHRIVLPELSNGIYAVKVIIGREVFLRQVVIDK